MRTNIGSTARPPRRESCSVGRGKLVSSKVLLLLCAAYCLLLTAYELVWACPLCSDALVAPGEAASRSRLAQGYAVTIAGMIATPLVLVGTVSALVVRSARRNRVKMGGH